MLGPFRRWWQEFYRRSSIQGILSLSFTAVAVVGMIFMGLALFFRFSANTNAQMAENSQRVLAQVNLNLDAYLRRMMRLSDTAYYSVIKDADLAEEDLSEALDLLYENNRDALVSIALFSEEGGISSPPRRWWGSRTASIRKRNPGSPPPWTGSKTSTFPRPMCKTSLRTRTTSTAGWYLSAGRWR